MNGPTLTNLLDSPALRQRNALAQEQRVAVAPRPYDPVEERRRFQMTMLGLTAAGLVCLAVGLALVGLGYLLVTALNNTPMY